MIIKLVLYSAVETFSVVLVWNHEIYRVDKNKIILWGFWLCFSDCRLLTKSSFTFYDLFKNYKICSGEGDKLCPKRIKISITSKSYTT
jgi:hypothetical protein